MLRSNITKRLVLPLFLLEFSTAQVATYLWGQGSCQIKQTILCESNSTLTYCPTSELLSMSNIIRFYSGLGWGSLCEYYPGSPDTYLNQTRVFGLSGGIPWADKGCGVRVDFCPVTSTTVSTMTDSTRSTNSVTLSVGQQFASTPLLTTVSTSETFSSLSVTIINGVSKPKPAFTKTALQQDDRDTSKLNVETVVGVTVGGTVGVAALGGGAYLLNSWVGRTSVSPLNIDRSVDI